MPHRVQRVANVFAALASFTPAASKSRRHIATLAAAFKRIHATVLQQRAARLQQKILAEQAAERAAQDQKLLEEVQQQAAEMRQRMADAQKSFAKSMRKQRKREAKEAKAAKRRGVDWSEWLPLFKVVTSSLGELVASYLQVRPKLAQLKKEGKDPGLKVFLLLEFLQAMEKYLHPERDSAAAPGQPAPAESTSAATVSAATADPGSAPAYGTAQPSPEHASGDRAAAPPTSTPDPESSPPAFQCDALPGFCKMLREMGIFAQAAASPKTPEQTSEAGTQDAPTPSPAEPAQDRAEGGPAARTPAPQISERMSETYPEIISPVSQAVLRPEYSGAASRFAESAEEKKFRGACANGRRAQRAAPRCAFGRHPASSKWLTCRERPGRTYLPQARRSRHGGTNGSSPRHTRPTAPRHCGRVEPPETRLSHKLERSSRTAGRADYDRRALGFVARGRNRPACSPARW